MNKQRLILLFAILALLTAAPFSNTQAQQPSESRLAQILKRFPAADANGDGKLTAEEFKAARQQFQRSRQGNARPAAAAQTKLVFDPGWEKEKFPPHAVSLKTPEEIMAIYKRGPAGQTPLRESDALSFPKPADGIMRIVGTGHSFMRPGYVTLPLITQAAGFEQPLSLHLGGGIKGSTRYKWEQENGIFEFDRKPLPKLLAAISNAKWEAMVWGPYTGDRPAFYTCWIDFCEKYNPGMKFYLSDAWPAPGHVRKVFKLQANPESEAFFTEAVYDQLSADAIAGFGGLVKTLRESTKEVYILPTHAAMTEAAKRFLRGELPGFKGLYKVIGGKEPSIWRDRIGHIHPGLESLEGYVFYATLYGKSPELISAPIKFKDDPSLPSAALDKIFREIAWKAVVEHPLSGVTDKNKNGIGDHLESRQVGDAALNKALEEINGRFKNVDVELLEWPEKLQQRLGKLKQIAFLATPVKTPAGKLPLLISLHGGGQRWWNMSLQEQLAISAPGGKIEKLRGFKKLRGYDLAELAGKGMILLEPNTAGLWDADSLDTMLDYVLANYPKIDKDRVYVMGYSMGGRGTWAWINESADRFAAAAPCGFNPADTGDVKKLVKLPIWAMAGGADGDRTTGVRKMVERLRAAGNVNVKHTEFEGADHRAGLAVFSSVELVEWMLRFSKGK